ncbi:MAG: hypothetical protein NVS3B5_01550 [Sphingomicrobium sp.]
MTMLAEKISKATKRPPRVFALGAAVIQFGKDGGTLEEAMQIVAEAFSRLQRSGHKLDAAPGPVHVAKPLQTLDDAGGRNAFADMAATYVPSASSSPSERGGHGDRADNGPHSVAAPAREPSAAQRSAEARIGKVIALTVMDTYQIAHRRADGKFTQTPLGELTISLARTEAKRKTAEGYVLREVVKMAEYRVANLTGEETINHVLGGDLMAIQRLIQKGAEYADAV